MSRSLLLGPLAAAVLAATAVTAASADAAPVNDQLADATVLSSSPNQSFLATTAGASTEAGEPDLYSMHRTVWFRWTPAATGGTYLAGCPGDADIEVYTGSTIATLDRVSGGGGKCSGDAKWVAKAGVTYRIRVNAHTIAAGSVEWVTLKQVTATPNAAMLATPGVTGAAGTLSFKETTGAEGVLIDACDVDGKTGWCYPDDDHFSAGLKGFPGLADGYHVLHVTLRDFYGNVDPTPLAYGFKVDAKAPITSLVGQPDPASGTPLLAFASNEPGSTFECRLDSATWVACASPWTMTVGFGSHTAWVRAIDPFGNVDQTSTSTTWNRKAPETPKPPKAVVPVVKPAPILVAPGVAGTTTAGPRPTTGTTGTVGARPGCRVTVTRPRTLTRRVLRKGLKVKVTAQAGCRWTLMLRRRGTTKALAKATGPGGAPTRSATLKPSRRAVGRIAPGARLELVAQATGAAGPTRTTATLTVRR